MEYSERFEGVVLKNIESFNEDNAMEVARMPLASLRQHLRPLDYESNFKYLAWSKLDKAESETDELTQGLICQQAG